jgi:hypothetical protein
MQSIQPKNISMADYLNRTNPDFELPPVSPMGMNTIESFQTSNKGGKKKSNLRNFNATTERFGGLALSVETRTNDGSIKNALSNSMGKGGRNYLAQQYAG